MRRGGPTAGSAGSRGTPVDSQNDAVRGRPPVLQAPEPAVESPDGLALSTRVGLPGSPPSFARRARLDALCTRLLAPLGAALFVFARSRSDAPLSDAVLAFLVFASSARAVRPQALRAAFCPLVGPFYVLTGPLLGATGLVGLHAVTARPEIGPLDFLAMTAIVLVVAHPSATVLRLLGMRVPRVRIAYIGAPAAAARLASAVEQAAGQRYVVVGYIVDHGGAPWMTDMPWLGPTDDLAGVVMREQVELLVLGPGAPRLQVYEEITRSCLDLPVRLVESADFSEEAFGHVPMSEIDATWFQHLLHPSFAPSSRAAKRTLDILVAGSLAILALPLVALLALLVRRDGGPALFVQPRIGQQGRVFRLLKLRTMRVGSSAEWADDDDPRVTRIGRFLRATHLDELPQLLNVVRGEMSLVGPRPEQPSYVSRLERSLPFYDRRHLIKPGLTGWAALRCGYAGSEGGSGWKLCHDLYYIAHRSVGFDLLILAETAAELVTHRGVTASQARSMLEAEIGSPARFHHDHPQPVVLHSATPVHDP
jgi:lipopolysaccharide/colanic/teichoic acid biosynthesis glycosyltransferase